MREPRNSGGVPERGKEEERHHGRIRPDVPDHEILRLIGKGAYGDVWLARSVTGAYRAVKVVWREDYEDEQLYVREFEGVLHYEPVARGIPGVVHILHVGQNAGEHACYYYVMELADDAYTGIQIDPEGYVPRTLASDMKLYGHKPMPLDYVLEVGSQLAHALDGLHGEELTHGDVKPTNIVFVHGRAKLADAGSVAPKARRNYAGTEGYIPPDGPGTARADVYALGMVLYELCTGKKPLEFPDLPPEVPEGSSHRKWLKFNEIICAAANPQVGKESIVSAQELAERMDELRHYAPRHHARMRRRRMWAKRAAVVLALLTLGGVSLYSFAPQEWWTRLAAARDALQGERRGKADQAAEGAQLFISTVPAGASIFREDGTYVDETPYGPVDMRPGENVAFVLRREGYSDLPVQGTVPTGGVLALGGKMVPFAPPRRRENWQDALGCTYLYEQGVHRAAHAVTVEQFESFLKRAASADAIRYEKVSGDDFVRTTREGITEYTLWLAHLCEARGSLGYDYFLTALPVPGTTLKDGLSAFRMAAYPVQKTPVTLVTAPPGATVWLNGRPLGVTPLRDVHVPLAPYFLEFRLAGYATERFSGISPKGLVLNTTLKRNHSVAFGTPWENSLGLRFLPLSPNLMACATEVRVADFSSFVVTTGTAPADPVDFVQEANHPAVGVSRADAERFAHWLTVQERERGLIEQSDAYRLPTDEEWSAMVGLKNERGSSPYERARSQHGTAHRQFSWGLHWPPPPGSGNFADDSARPYLPPQRVLEHYSDSFPFTAPVGSFAPNVLGFNDLAGNVQEWVSDEYGGPPGFPFRHYAVTRGGDFTSFRPSQLSAGVRTPRPADERSSTVGFRLMLERNLNQSGFPTPTTTSTRYEVRSTK